MTMRKLLVFLLCLAVLSACLTGCSLPGGPQDGPDSTQQGAAAVDGDLGDDNKTFGEDLEDTGVYEGYFEADTQDVTITCVSGTPDAYSISGSTVTFSGITEDSIYSISGRLTGNIVIDVAESYKFELEMNGFSLVSAEENPIQALGGDKVTLTAKKDSENFIYDMRAAVDEEAATKGAVYAAVDLQIGGKGSLSVVSENNNGIHTKDDLTVKNLTLTVACQDNALKGNDSVTLTDGTVTLIAKTGDGIKTTNSDISSKGNQKGTVSVTGTNLTVYAACDGIDAAYNAVIDGEATCVSIYTDKYSNYSDEITAVSGSEYYIRFTSKDYQYSVKYYNSDSDYVWVDAGYHSAVSGGMRSYYYFSYPKLEGYTQVQFFIYSSDMPQSQEDEYLVASDYLALNTAYDTFALSSSGGGLYYEWTNYTTTISGGMSGPGGHGGMGGMGGGNTDKGDHSTKGIKAVNEIILQGGTVNIKSYDDALHADNSTALENGETPLGNITVSGGSITLYSNDDGVHAEGSVTVSGGQLEVENSYEGVEGTQIFITGGSLAVYAKDDGLNSTATSGTGITLSGGFVYVYCTGDGFDTNSRTSYAGIHFAGGDAIIIANSSGNSAIDTEQGYQYTAGSIVAIMPRGGMTGEATHCQNFSSVGSYKNMSLSSGSTLTLSGAMERTFTMPCSISSAIVVLLNPSLSISA